MKVKGANGLVVEVPEQVATAMIAAGHVREVAGHTAEVEVESAETTEVDVESAETTEVEVESAEVEVEPAESKTGGSRKRRA